MTEPKDKSGRPPERGGQREDELGPLNRDDLKQLDGTELGAKGDDAVKGGGDVCGRSR
jgi:hypothetical protein